MNMGPFAGFIIASYAATALVVVGLIAWVTVDGRRQGRPGPDGDCGEDRRIEGHVHVERYIRLCDAG